MADLSVGVNEGAVRIEASLASFWIVEERLCRARDVGSSVDVLDAAVNYMMKGPWSVICFGWLRV